MAFRPTAALSIPILNPATQNLQFNATLTTSTWNHRILRLPLVRECEGLYRIELKLENAPVVGGGRLKIYWKGNPTYTDRDDFYIHSESVTRYIRSDGRLGHLESLMYLVLGHGDRIEVELGSDRDGSCRVEFTFNVVSPTSNWQMSGPYPGQSLAEVFGGYAGPVPVNTVNTHGQGIPQGQQASRVVSNPSIDRAMFEFHDRWM